MTLREAIVTVRLLLDEPRYEYYGSSTDIDGEVIDALRQALANVARSTWYRMEKEAVRPLMRSEVVGIDVNGIGVVSEDYLLIYSVVSNLETSDAQAPLYSHRYVPPALFARRTLRNPEENPGAMTSAIARGQLFTSTKEYTVEPDRSIRVHVDPVTAVGNYSVRVGYLAVPTINAAFPALPLPIAEYVHGYVCDVAAEILWRKDHDGQDRPALGGMYDLDGLLHQMAQQKAKQ